jgi:colanic acid biosynthesis glycosyl transferase WcaI
VLFSGTLGEKQGRMVIPAVARLLASRKDIVFVVCGEGLMNPQLQHASADLQNIRLIPLQPFEHLGDLLCMADIHLLPQNRGAVDLVMPSRLSGMLASGRPVVATCLGGTELAAMISKCGIVVPAQDSAAVAAAICSLADDVATRLETGSPSPLFCRDPFRTRCNP